MAGTAQLGSFDHGQRTDNQQLPKVWVSSLTDAAEFRLAAAGVLFWHQPNPGAQITSGSKDAWIGDASSQGCCHQGTNARNSFEFAAEFMGAMPLHNLSVNFQYLLL